MTPQEFKIKMQAEYQKHQGNNKRCLEEMLMLIKDALLSTPFSEGVFWLEKLEEDLRDA